MQNISVKITKGRQLKAYLKSGIQGPQGAEGLRGEKGDAGEQGLQGLSGEKGDKGDTGEQGLQGIAGQNGIDGRDGTNGQDGKSAYQSALENGFTGAEQEWLLSLKGDKGDAGDSGIVFAQSPLEYNSETKTIQVASGYIIPAQNALDNKVDKVNGKGLSANDLTDDLKNNYDTAYIGLGNIQAALTAILGV